MIIIMEFTFERGWSVECIYHITTGIQNPKYESTLGQNLNWIHLSSFAEKEEDEAKKRKS